MATKEVALVSTLTDAQLLTSLSEAVDAWNITADRVRELWANAQERWLQKEGRARTDWERKCGERFGKLRLAPGDRLELDWHDGQPERSRARMMGVSQKTVNNDRQALSKATQSPPPKPAKRGTRKEPSKPRAAKASEPAEPTWIDDDGNPVEYSDDEPIIEATIVDDEDEVQTLDAARAINDVRDLLAALISDHYKLSKADKRKLLTTLKSSVAKLEG